jgi:hypothetical protein
MNTTTQINTGDLVNYACQYITYDISALCDLDGDLHQYLATAIDKTLLLESRQKGYSFDRSHIEVFEDRQIAFVHFSVESFYPKLETALEDQLRSTMRSLDYFSESLDCYVTATAIDAS